MSSRTRTVGLFCASVLLVGALTAAAAHATRALGHAGKRKAAARASTFPAFRGSVPVLIYHRLGLGGGGYSVSTAAFEAQLRRLHDLGFEAITLDHYVAFMRGKKVDLPQRPILITFDDAYASALQYADPVLARFGWSATMYVPTAAVGRPGHLSWDQLRQMESSGRWQVGEHAGDGHVLITVDAGGRAGPFYTNELWAHGQRESFAAYKRRVANDLELGATLLARNLPGKSHDTFAVPFGNYGQYGSNDRRIEPWFVRYLKRHFAVSFVQHDHSFTREGQRFGNRIAVGSRCDAHTLELRLRQGLEQLEKGRRQAAKTRAHPR